MSGGIVPLMMKKTTRNYIWVLAANFLLLLVVGVIWQARLESEAFATEPPIEGVVIVRDKVSVPEVAYLQNLSTPAKLSDLKGQWMLLNLWASWCGPCIVEMPSLEKFAADYKGKGLHVIAVSMDVDAATAERAIKQHGFGSFARNWDDKGDMMKVFDPPALPSSMLIDPAGNLRATFSGQYDWADPILRELIDKLLPKSSTSVPARS